MSEQPPRSETSSEHEIKKERISALKRDLFVDSKKDLSIEPEASPFESGSNPLIHKLAGDILEVSPIFEPKKFVPQETTFSTLGKELERVGRGRTFFDLGNGDYTLTASNYAPAMAQLVGCKRYVGVDLWNPPEGEVRRNKYPNISKDFESYFLHGDIRKFLQNLKVPPEGAVCLLTSLDTLAERNDPTPYINDVLAEITRITQKGGGVLLGTILRGRFNHITEHGFRQVAASERIARDEKDFGYDEDPLGLRLFEKV